MSNETENFTWDNVKADENTDENRPFLNLVEVPEAIDTLTASMTFESNDPMHVGEDSYGNDKHIFKVLDVEGKKCLFSTSSKRCMMAIKGLMPIENKNIEITRRGTSFDTAYIAEEF